MTQAKRGTRITTEGIPAKKSSTFGPLRYLYIGSKSVQKDLDYYTKVLGAEKVWDISSSGTRVAAVRLGKGPLVLLADHRPAGSCIMIFQVESLKEASEKLRKRGWRPEGEEFEIPEGPCYRFNDPSGNALANTGDCETRRFGD